MSLNADNIKLTEWTSCGGCAAKWGASLLSELVADLPPSFDSSVLVGLAPFDDAAVYQLTDDVALVSTTDFFPPLVDNPFDFGAIAAANACSDVFAMGGKVILAVNIAAFPENLPHDVIAAIFSAASDVVTQAGGTIAGGHTIRNPEPIFGLAVQGVVHPQKIFRKVGAQPGDVAMVSKPIGTGLVTAAGTDVQKQVAIRSGVTLTIDTSSIPTYNGARELARAGHRTGGDPRNRAYVGAHLSATADETSVALCMDPQTSGGLLAAVHPSAVSVLQDHGFVVIGAFDDGGQHLRLS